MTCCGGQVSDSRFFAGLDTEPINGLVPRLSVVDVYLGLLLLITGDGHDGLPNDSRFNGPAMNNGAPYSPLHAVMSSHDLTDAQESLEGRDQLVEESHPGIQFLPVHRSVVASTRGGLAALLCSWVRYWTLPASDGEPRCRPQSGRYETSWITTSKQLCTCLALDFASTAHRKQLHRAINKLRDHPDEHCRIVVHRGIEDPWFGEIDLTTSTAHLVRTIVAVPVSHRWVITPAGTTDYRDYWLKVYLLWITRMDPNAAILLSRLWWLSIEGGLAIPSRCKWISAAYSFLAVSTGLSPKQIRVAGTKLIQRGLVEHESGRGDHPCRWRISPERLFDLNPRQNQPAGSATIPQTAAAGPEMAHVGPERAHSGPETAAIRIRNRLSRAGMK